MPFHQLKSKRVLVAGGRGFLGRHLIRKLLKTGASVFAPGHDNFEMKNQIDAADLIKGFKPDIIINLAGKVGGITHNILNRGALFYDNILPGIMLLHEAAMAKVDKFVQIGSVCEYPANCHNPLYEADLWKGYPEWSNAPYGIAKRALLEMGMAYMEQYGITVNHVLLANLYGPGDNFTDSGHVIPSMIRKFTSGEKKVVLFGTGKPTRDFLYVSDAAGAIVRITDEWDSSHPINVSTNKFISIKHLAEKIAGMTKYNGKIEWDESKPDGQIERVVNNSQICNLGWKPTIGLDDGLRRAIKWYKANQN